MLTNSITPDSLGGLNRYVRELSAALVRKGVRVTVATKRVRPELPAREVAADGVEIHRYEVTSKRSPHFLVSYAPRIASAVWRELDAHAEATDVVHAHYPVSALPAGDAATALRVHVPRAGVSRGAERATGQLQASARARTQCRRKREADGERHVTGRAGRIALLSEFVRNELAALHPQLAKSAALIPGGLDIDRSRPGDAAPMDDWAADATDLLFTARRLAPRMGIVELVKAMPRVVAEHPGVKLAIAGSGGMQRAIEDEIRAHGLEDSVRMLGRISDEDSGALVPERVARRHADAGARGVRPHHGRGARVPDPGRRNACGGDAGDPLARRSPAHHTRHDA